MTDKLKGFKTVILSIVTMVTGALVGSGLLTPDLGTDVTAATRDVISAFELVVGAIQVLIGVAFAAVRAVTNTPIFKKS